jgi:hypothetical protein
VKDVELIQLLRDSEQWQALVYTVTNPRVPHESKKFLDQLTDYILLKNVSTDIFMQLNIKHSWYDLNTITRACS